MDWYPLVKLVHFMGLIALFGFFVLFSRAGGRLRAATTHAEARSWLGLLDVARPMLPSGIVMLTASGGIMAWQRWRGAYPFLVVGLATAAVIWAAWAIVGARYLRSIRSALGDGDGPLTAPVGQTLGDPARWATLGAINGAALGVLAIMALKPGWVGCVLVVAVLAALTALSFAIAVGRARDTS